MYRARRLTLALAAWVLAPGIAGAYPISPKPLWSLTAEAELIVVAEVVAVDDLPVDNESWASAVAHLRVIETLKGPSRSVIEVPFAATLTCPAPPRYSAGETVVAFLSLHRKEWRTVSLSYGTLYPRGDDLGDMAAMVRTALVIQRSISSYSELERRRQEWLVQAAALPGTRWHGLYELAPATDRFRSYYDRTERAARLPLSEQQRALLAKAFVEAPKIDPSFAMMLRVLGNFEDVRVDERAVAVLKGLLALEQPPRWTLDTLWAVLARFGESNPEARLKALGISCWNVTAQQMWAIWTEAQEQVGAPDVPRVEVDPEEYIPVGSRTPSWVRLL